MKTSILSLELLAVEASVVALAMVEDDQIVGSNKEDIGF
jgi:hypothetical protein